MSKDNKKTETKQCTIPSVVCSAFSNDELENMMNTWFDHYHANGESHYSDTPDFRIREIYWDIKWLIELLKM